MAYKDKDRQREYQRSWAASKARLTEKPKIQNYGIIYYKDLTEIAKIKEIASYGECIKEAKRYISARHINRLAIAELALQSCRIEHGGDRRSSKFKNGIATESATTLKRFAKDIDITYTTLQRWVRIVETIIKPIQQKNKKENIDWSVCELAYSKTSRTLGTPEARYEKLKNDNTGLRGNQTALRYFNSGCFHFLKYGIKSLETAEREKFLGKIQEMADKFL